MNRITWSKFKIYKTVDADLNTAQDLEFPFHPGSRFRAVNTGIDEPTCQINYEDFNNGREIAWSMPHDEVQYVVSGRAEIEYHLPPLMLESGKVIAEPGSVYLLPQGARIVWRVLSDEPFRHLCICYPNPGYPIAKAASIAGKA
jgi:quercetin dioxygenase-like cupin family protein